MLYFPQKFFDSEEREGFIVDSTMKSVWAAEMEILAVVASICEKYQLPWFVDWGTLLGAVRHGGFIPWDDDMDISLLKPDYDKLMEVLPKELPEGWILRHDKYGKPQEQYWACVMNSSNISIEKKRLEDFHGCPFIVGLDIFQLDYIPRDERELEWEKAVFNLVYKTVQLAKKKEKTEEDEADIKAAINKIQQVTKIKIDRKRDIVSQLWAIGDTITSSYKEEESDCVGNFLVYVKKGKKHNKHWYDDVEYLPFETVEVPVPISYDDVLKVHYGDYMKYEKNTQSHDYPYYNKQLEELRGIVRKMEEEAENNG